jgi:CubicO group peptidase (beta-lactamase class C family)
VRRAAAALALVAASMGAGGVAVPAVAQAVDQAALDAAARTRVDAAVAGSGFVGTYAVYAGPRRIAAGSVGQAVEGQPGGFDYAAVWPWASVTKQVVATLVMQEVEAGRLSLDTRASRYLPAYRGTATLRQLLQHRSGLRNPDASAKDAGGEPSFYTDGATGLGWCLAGTGAPGGRWAYNNCDYIVLGAVLERATRLPFAELFARRIAQPLGLTAHVVGASDGVDEHWAGGPTAAERRTIVRYGAAGALEGTAVDLITLDRALLSGALLSNAARADLWKGDPALGSMALGQWSFAAPLAGCAGPQAIVERRGSIGRFAVRNLILPAQGLSIVLFTNRGDPEGDGGFGEIWQGKGRSYAIASAAVCG